MCLHSSRDSARNWNHPEDVSTTRIELHSCHVVIHEHDAEHLGSITFTIALTAENIVVEDVLKALLPSVPNYEYFLFATSIGSFRRWRTNTIYFLLHLSELLFVSSSHPSVHAHSFW